MAEKQKQIIDYTPATTLATGDKLLLQKADGSTMNVDYAELARNIITQYNAQTLAGSAQSVQSAINIVNNKANAITSKLAWHNLGTISSIDALNTALGNLVSGETGISANSHVYYFWFTTSGSFPPFSWNGSIFIGEMTVATGERYNVLVQNHGDIGNFFRGTCLTGTWTWVKLPSRAEFDALNSNLYNANLGTVINNNDDLDTYTKPGTYHCNSASKAETLAHCPVNNSGFKLLVIRTGYENANLIQIIEVPIGLNDGGSTYRRMGNPSAWGNWVKSPTRYDIDTLNSNIEKRAMGSQATYIPNGADLDTYLTFGLYCSGSATVSATLSHAPITIAGFLLEVKRTSNSDTVLVQEALVNGNVMQKFKRWHSINGWTDWIEEPNRSEITALNSNFASKNYTVFNTTTLLTTQVDALPVKASYCGVISSYNYVEETGVPVNSAGYIEVFSESANYKRLFFYPMGSTDAYVKDRNSTGWGDWVKIPTRSEVDALKAGAYGLSYAVMTTIKQNDDLNAYTSPGSYISTSTGITSTLANVPFNNSGFSLHVESVAGGSGQYIVQTIKRVSDRADEYTRAYNGTAWTEWRQRPNSIIAVSISGTTSASGNLEITGLPTGAVPIFCYSTLNDSTPHWYEISRYGGKWYARCYNPNGLVTSTAVAGMVLYVKL